MTYITLPSGGVWHRNHDLPIGDPLSFTRAHWLFAVLLGAVASVGAANTLTWAGGAGQNWSTAANWVENAVPQSGDSLRFTGQVGDPAVAMVNDLPDRTEIVSIQVTRPGFSLSGNVLALGGDITGVACNVPGAVPSFEFHNDVVLTKFVTVTGSVFFRGAVDINFQTLTLMSDANVTGRLDGDGYLVLDAPNGGNCSMDLTENGGSFTGAVILKHRNVYVNGSLPQTSLQAPPGVWYVNVIGSGEVNEISMPDGYVNPTGTLTTSSMTTGGFNVTLAGSGRSPHVVSNGPVVLNSGGFSNGGTLFLSIAPPLTAGEQITIIDNRSSSATSGTFARVIRPGTSAPNPPPTEGAILTIDGYRLRISYSGGDGNDVVLTVLSGTKQWTGQADSSWSNPNNWAPAVVPQPDEDLVFPRVGFLEHQSTNDLAAYRSGALKCTDSRCTIDGNLLTVGGDITGPFTFLAPIRLGASLAITSNISKAWAFDGYQDVDVGGKTMTLTDSLRVQTLDGSGSVNVNQGGLFVVGPRPFFNGALEKNPVAQSAGTPDAALRPVRPEAVFDPTLPRGSFQGTINCGGDFDITGQLPGANIVSNGEVRGDGALGTITIGSTGFFTPGYHHWTDAISSSPDIGTLTTQSAALGGRSEFNLFGRDGSDLLSVHGSVSLGGPLRLTSGKALAPPMSIVFIDNDGTDPVVGTFAGVPEGASVPISTPAGDASVRISYRGGDGNDVAAYAVGPTSAVLAQSLSVTRAGQAFKLTATVSASFGTPTGNVTFRDGATVLGTAPLANGVASLSVTLSSLGFHSLTAKYVGETSFLDSDAPAISHEVRATPLVSISISNASVIEGNSGTTDVTLSVTLSAPATDPVRVSFATFPGTATEGVDYQAASGVIGFAPGEQATSITLHVIGDTLVEDDETFYVVLSNPVNAAIDTPAATIVIVNDDRTRRRAVLH